jgi:hypothetical protein
MYLCNILILISVIRCSVGYEFAKSYFLCYYSIKSFSYINNET